MTTRRQLVLASASALAIPHLVRAQPDKPPIRVLVGFPPGGATDAIARVVLDRLPAELGRQVVVENRPGAGGRLAADALLAAPADGSTYMVAPNATPTFQTLVFSDRIRWRLFRDFVPVASFASYPLGMAIAKHTGATNAREFVEWALRNPGKASLGTPGLGGQNYFLGIEFSRITGVKLLLTPYKGTPPMITDLLGGHIAAGISPMDLMMAHHRAGTLRAIGVFAPQRSPLMPDMPTFAEQGIDMTNGEGWTAMWAPAGTPATELARMEQAIAKVVAAPDVKETLTTKLFVHPHFRDAKATAELQRTELAVYEPIVKASGFKPEE